jgi:formylglycine-generating enzyme required for sulfatase activity
MNKLTTAMKLSLCALALGANVDAQAQAPVITSFSGNGVLVCSNLAPGSVATVEWGASLSGPWQTNWAGLDAVTVASNGMIQVSVPMFYRVRGLAQTNSAPPYGMALIPAGTFTMGDCMNDEYDSDELPLHTVYVSAFYMDKYDVTKALWDSVYQWATNHGYSFDYAGSGKAANHPVQTIDWYDAVKWCNARSEKEGRVPAYYTSAAQTTVYRTGEVHVDNSSVNWDAGYRLPTEAEWEKAARGGLSGQRFPWGNTISWSQANYYALPLSAGGHAYDVNPTQGYNPTFATGGQPYTSPAGCFAANGYGLYDMAGNVWQWCWDWYGSYASGSQSDPRGPASPASGSYRVIRGGSWDDGAVNCRSASRLVVNFPIYSYPNYFGFRSVLPPGQ